MSAKVAIQFPPRSGGGIKRKGDRRISMLDSNIVRDGGRGRNCGRYMAATAVTTLDLTGTTYPMAGFMESNAPTSGGVSTENNLTRLGAMGACMYSTSARVTSTPATSRRFIKVGKMMRSS